MTEDDFKFMNKWIERLGLVKSHNTEEQKTKNAYDKEEQAEENHQ
jgi:hypothetical protein